MLFSFYGCSAVPSASADASPDPTPSGIAPTPVTKYDSVQQITWVRVAESALKTQTLEFLLLNFGLRINEQNFVSQNMSDRILLLYSANISPELATGISVNGVKTLAERGFLEDLDDEQDSLADYFALWDSWQQGWEYTSSDIMVQKPDSDDMGLYCIVPVNRKSSKAWIYNKTLFDENGMTFPKTLTELYETLARYKEAHTTSSAIWTNSGDGLQFTAILNAYGLTDQKWQTDENGEVFYLYADKNWYRALEWLVKFEKLGIVPTDDEGRLKSYSSDEYNNITQQSQQIIEFTDSYNYLYIQSKQKNNSEWAVADVMITAEAGVTPVLSSNVPYINEAACIASTASSSQKKQILAFLNWCCTEEGNMWANFGQEGVGYRFDSDDKFVFLKYYSDETTPAISAEKNGSISDITVGRMFTTVPWDKISLDGYTDRYSAQEKFMSTAHYRLALPERFVSTQDVIEDMTQLWRYTKISEELDRLSAQFIEYSRENGFSDYFWDRYYESLLDAGLEEYVQLMQMRKK